MYILILAGGRGTRLWPVSRENKPKQISEIFGGATMIEKTWQRLRKVYPAKNIFICTDRKSEEFIRLKLKDLSKENLLVEPLARGTAAAIGYGAAHIFARYGAVPMIVVSADAHIGNEVAYLNTLKKVGKILAEQLKQTILVGVKPQYAETGYGYIKFRKKRNAEFQIYKVDKFIEKPSFRKAREYVRSGNYLWNPGIFGWNTLHLFELYSQHLPKTYHGLEQILREIKLKGKVSQALLGEHYQKMETTSIDYGILEKERRLLVVTGDFLWADIGNWRAVHEILRQHPADNVVSGRHMQIGSSGNLIYSHSKRLITTVDLKDMVVIESPDAILICPREASQDVKRLTELLRKNGLEKYL